MNIGGANEYYNLLILAKAIRYNSFFGNFIHRNNDNIVVCNFISNFHSLLEVSVITFIDGIKSETTLATNQLP